MYYLFNIYSPFMSPFLISFIISLLVTRFGVYLTVNYLRSKNKELPGPTIFNLRIHHYHYGIILFILAIILNSQILLGIGLALFMDELPFILLRGNSHEQNYSLTANIGVIIFGILVVIFQQEILRLLLN
jgi:hypothetical protein